MVLTINLGRMKGIKDWVLSQLVSTSLVSSRSPSGSDGFLDEEPLHEEFGSQDSLAAQIEPADSSSSLSSNSDNLLNPVSPQIPAEDHCSNEKKMDTLAKIEGLQINFLRVLQRLGQSHDNLLVAKVLYRLHLATLIRSGESDVQRANLRSNRAKEIAAEQELAGLPELDFAMRILVLGKTGIGKSATINSIFDQPKTATNAFHPATDHIQMVKGTVNGIRLTVIDTPGLLPSSMSSLRRNRKVLLSVKRLIKKFPPDIVLYFERLDLINQSYSDLPLLKLITDVFGSAIWFNTILVMTHSSSLPEGANEYPVRYDYYVSQCTNLVQLCVHQAVSDSRLENPVLLVENHPHCMRNIKGEKILPNGQAWKSEFLLLCTCTKVLSNANTLLKFHPTFELGPLTSARSPSLPHLLSSFLQRHPLSSPSKVAHEFDDSLFAEFEDDEYDQLPPIRILSKSQFEKLTNLQKKDYLDELDYRETLYLKKQLKEEYQRRKELSKEGGSANHDIPDRENSSPDAVMLPDMALPPSFDSECPVHRYRCLVTTDQCLVRPVLDPHGWDHDVGFDGINLEATAEIKQNVLMSVIGQIRKDKQDFSVQSEFAAAYASPRGPTYCLGLDVQSAGKDLSYAVHSSAKLKTISQNKAECGLSVTSFGDKYYIGAKLEDAISIGSRLEFVMNAGRMVGHDQVADGGSLKAILRGRDYPVRNDYVSLMMTALSFNKEIVLGGHFQSEFRLSRGRRMSVNANLNSRKMGQISVKTSSSEHVEIALVALVSIFRALIRRIPTNEFTEGTLETG